MIDNNDHVFFNVLILLVIFMFKFLCLFKLLYHYILYGFFIY